MLFLDKRNKENQVEVRGDLTYVYIFITLLFTSLSTPLFGLIVHLFLAFSIFYGFLHGLFFSSTALTFLLLPIHLRTNRKT